MMPLNVSSFFIAMNVCTGFLLFCIFALTNSATKTKLKDKHWRDNPSLDSIKGHINDEIRDTKTLDNIQRNIPATVKDEKKSSQLVVTAPEVETFTDFIQETVDLLNTYEPRAFEDFFRILDTEIRTYHYDGCKFSELMQNRNTRALLAGALKSVKENSVTVTKANINEIADLIRIQMYDENVKELLDYINSLYKNTEGDFDKILQNLKLYTKIKSKETYNDLELIVRDGVRTILFDHYTKLAKQTRRELKEKIETFWEKYKKTSASNDDINSLFDKKSVDKVVKTIENKIKEYEQKISERKKVPDQRKRIVGVDTFDERFENNEMKMRTIEPGKLAKNFIIEESSSEKTEYTTVNTKPKKTKPVLRAQEEFKAIKGKGNALSRYSKKTHSYHGIEPVFRSRVEQAVKNMSKIKNDGMKYFNEYVNKKIYTIENELTKLKQINDLRTRLIDSNVDEIKNITDRIEIINDKDNKRKYLQTNIVELLQNYYTNIEESDGPNTMKKEFTSKSNARFRANDENKRAGDATNFNNKTRPILIRKNIDTTTIHPEDLNKNVRRSDVTSNDSTVDYTTPKAHESVVTDPATEDSNKEFAVTDKNGVIHHKNPYDFIGK